MVDRQAVPAAMLFLSLLWALADGSLNVSSSTGRSLLQQKQYVSQEQDHKSILKLKPSETAAQDLASHVGAAADVQMWDMLWPEQHRSDQHAVFSLALNYGDRHFHWFVGSLRKVGYQGDIVLALSPSISGSLETFLKAQRTIAYPLYVKCKSKLQCVIEKWFSEIDGTLPSKI